MVIYKYRITGSGIVVGLPTQARIISAGYQPDDIFIWAIVDPKEKAKNERFITVIPTGVEFKNDPNLFFIDTVIDRDSFVWHIFEMLNYKPQPKPPGGEGSLSIRTG